MDAYDAQGLAYAQGQKVAYPRASLRDITHDSSGLYVQVLHVRRVDGDKVWLEGHQEPLLFPARYAILSNKM